jgi:hypothetical protein
LAACQKIMKGFNTGMKVLIKNLLSGFALAALIFNIPAVPAVVSADKTTIEDKKQNEDKDKERSDAKKSDIIKRIDKFTAEQLAEVVIISYGGRNELGQVRTNGIEEGNIKLATDDKNIEGRIIRKFLRRDQASQDLTRVDVELPTNKLTFGFNGYTVWGARDGVNFTLTPEAEASFLASLVHNYDALLRYKEQGSTVERAGYESIVGIDTFLLDLTHKDGSKTRYYVSTKTYRILHLEYQVKLKPDAAPTKFRESFFDFRPVQNTLVPGKSVLYENDKFIQEISFTQVKYHTKIDEETFLKF